MSLETIFVILLIIIALGLFYFIVLRGVNGLA